MWDPKSNQDRRDEEDDEAGIEEELALLTTSMSSSTAAKKNVLRPVPLHSTPPSAVVHPRLQAVLNNPMSFMPSPPSSPMSLPLMSQHHEALSDPEKVERKTSSGRGSAAATMSRSISDSTLRRAALHLNLSNQSVLPSFTSLQQFKKELSLSSSRRPSNRSHRKSMIVQTSPTLPRCHSPITGAAAAAANMSPMDSPKVSPSQYAFANVKKVDGRRWSFASLPSSGYGTTPGSSNVSSQCSSQERLLAAAASGPSHQHPPPLAAHQHHHHQQHQQQQQQQQHSQLSRFSSNDSNPSLVDDDVVSRLRPRSRSLSSPIRSPVPDNEIVMMNTLYKERFPKATRQMEERLKNFIDSHASEAPQLAIVRFVHHQMLEMARDCLQKSQSKLITSMYFYEMSENLEKLLAETKDKSPEATAHLTGLIKKLLLIVSRPARLLECLEFDPEEFYQLLEAAEGQARGVHGVSTNVPQYIVGKLGLNRDPLADFNQDLSSLDGDEALQEVEREKKVAAAAAAEKDEEKETVDSARVKQAFKDPSDDDFDVVKLISNGAYGAVYLVKHKETRQRFALKRINKQNLILRNQVDQVFAERDIMSFTDNPFVVSMYCSFETKKHLCMVMEYVEGGDCAILLKNMGPFPADMARFYFAETVLAVEYLHSFGIVHRDLKPDNLLITALGHIKLTDFGLSKMGLMSLATNLYEGYVDIDKETKQFSDKQVFGTPEYIAPEVILRQGYGKPVDWWSMGIILYEFLIGCVPFFGDTPEELFAHTVNDDIEWPQDDDWPVQPEAKDIITVLLQQNPLERLGTSGLFEVKDHHYFDGMDWNTLLRMKADFIPQLEGDEDTSYFDVRTDRYKHGDETRSSGDDDGQMFASFTSASPRYRRATTANRHSMFESSNSDQSEGSRTASSEEASRTSAASHLSCPDLETMVARAGGLNLGIPNRALEMKPRHTSSPVHSEDSEDVSLSPLLHRRSRKRESLPKFSIQVDEPRMGPKSLPVTPKVSVEPNTPSPLVTGKSSIVKSSSATGLSLMLDESMDSPTSSASSRDVSPCRELSLVNSLQAPIIVRRGPKGFGFTIRAIRVYLGDTDFYVVHHLVMEVDKGSPAFDAGLRPGDLVTHVNGEQVQGLLHTQVLQILLSGGEAVTLRATSLEMTSIKTGGRRRDPQVIRMARRSVGSRRTKKTGGGGGKRKTSLFRKLSSKKATAEMAALSSSQSLHSLKGGGHGGLGVEHAGSRSHSLSTTRSHSLRPELANSDSCSSADSSPCSPGASDGGHQGNRPSSLHGLKHKLHVAKLNSSSRRKSAGHIPLSPLARTPSPSPIPMSPTRSPSPLSFAFGHHVGSSNSTQVYSPGGASLTPGSAKKSFNRPKSAEPGSPLLRRALSPDRIHRSDGKKNTTISPLCSPSCKVVVSTTPKLTISTSHETSLLPSRAIHASPVAAAADDQSQQQQQQVLMRKHSKPSLSQPTIPEEGPEHYGEEEGEDEAAAVAAAKPKSRKSPSPEGEAAAISTVQRITNAIRGSSGRFEPKSKKQHREGSLSPSHGGGSSSSAVHKVTRKDSAKKNAQEKRDLFKSTH